ncbi:MAG: acyl-ACP--UDP-N-acetylglucosamine O-acyltransferase [Vicinamibacteraceae bacterium]
MPTITPIALDRLSYRYPVPLVDAVVSHERGRSLEAVKSVTVSEDFFQGHFPGQPVMPGVLMLESLAQAAAILLLDRDGEPQETRAALRGVDGVKFRRQIVPGDRVRLSVRLIAERGPIARVAGQALVDDQVVAEATLVIALMRDGLSIHPTANVDLSAVIGAGSSIGPNATIGPHVRLGRRCKIGASSVIDGFTELGDDNEVFPLASIGLRPQDLKYAGEPTRLVVGQKNVFREFVTVHRGTVGGGGVTTIGDRNVFMAYAHVAHDCHVGDDTIFGNAATLGGHVTVQSYATISAFSAVHQFCRIGRHAFIGGFSVITKDALPFAKTVGNRPARNYGLNTIGLVRRRIPADAIAKLKQAYRYLLTSKLNTTRALAEIERDPALSCPEVGHLVDFIRTSSRGVVLRRTLTRRADDSVVADE